jgi:hypothetical protein
MKITDFSNRPISIGDAVVVLNSIDVYKKTAQNMDTLVIGEVDYIKKGGSVHVTLNSKNKEGFFLKGEELSKIDLKDNLDDVIIHIAQDIEALQLLKESEILDCMLNPEE